MSDKDLIKDQVLAIKKVITSGEDNISAYDWLEGALDIVYKVDSAGTCIGGEVLVCFGGPTVWVDTDNKLIRGYWWSDNCLMHYHDDPMGINDAIIDLWECTR